MPNNQFSGKRIYVCAQQKTRSKKTGSGLTNSKKKTEKVTWQLYRGQCGNDTIMLPATTLSRRSASWNTLVNLGAAEVSNAADVAKFYGQCTD